MFSTEGRGPAFRLFGVPITIDWGFAILVALVLVAGYRPLEYSLVLIGVIFVSVLLHELGHAAAFGAIGRRSRIVITGFGGLTISEDERDMRDGEAVAVSLAGPAAEIGLGLAALALSRSGVGDGNDLTRVLLRDMVWVNLIWGFANLVPVLPLDGGHVMERIVHKISPRHSDVLPSLISVLVALPVAVYAWVEGFAFGAIFAGLFALLNLRGVKEGLEAPRRRRRLDAADAALAALGHADPGNAIDALRAARAQPLPGEVAGRCAIGLAWALTWRDGPGDLDEIEGLRSDSVVSRSDLVGAWVALRRGRRPESFALLARGFATDPTDPPDWFVDRMLPTPTEVDELTEWLAQMELDRRHIGMGRLTRCLLRAGRPEAAAAVRAHMARPVV